METIEFRAMGCGMMAVLDGEGKSIQRALEVVPAWFEEWECCLSRFRPKSELSRLNKASGRWIGVSETMWSMLVVAQKLEAMSGGLVTATMGGVLESIGYNRSFELVGTLGANLQFSSIQSAAHPQDWIEMERDGRLVRLACGIQLDFGGMAKGWAADRALERLCKFGPALVDAGGDIATSEPGGAWVAWPVGITDPHLPAETIGRLALRGEAVATSGRDVRRWQQGLAWRHHILDPRTGEPATNSVLAVTVVAPSAVEAEMAAKCAMILGEVDGLTWLNAHPPFAGLLVLEDGRQLWSTRMESYLWSS